MEEVVESELLGEEDEILDWVRGQMSAGRYKCFSREVVYASCEQEESGQEDTGGTE